MTVDFIPAPGEAVAGVGVLNRVGEPAELGNAIAFLASEACGFITGSTVVIDGGQLAYAPDPAPAS